MIVMGGDLMDILSELTLNPQIQVIVPLLLVIVPMLRSIPKLPKWTNQWIILFLALLLGILQSGFNIHAIYNGFIASMAVTYVTRGVVGYQEEKDLCQLKQQVSTMQNLMSSKNDDDKHE